MENPTPEDSLGSVNSILQGVGKLSVQPDEEPAVEVQMGSGVWRVYAPHGTRYWRLLDPRGQFRGSYRDAEAMATHMAMSLEECDRLRERALDYDSQCKAMIDRAVIGSGHPRRFQSVPEMLIAHQQRRIAELEARVERARDLCRTYEEPLGQMVMRELAEPTEEENKPHE